MTMRALCVLLLAVHASAWAQNNPVDPARVLDTFDQLAAWQAGASDGVRASIQKASGPEGPALRLDFDLAGTAGYALAARALGADGVVVGRAWLDGTLAL